MKKVLIITIISMIISVLLFAFAEKEENKFQQINENVIIYI